MQINNCPKCNSGNFEISNTIEFFDIIHIKIKCDNCLYEISGINRQKLINEWNKKMEDNGKEAYIKVLEDFIQKLRSEEVTDFEIESSNPPQMMFSPEHRDFIRVPSENHSIDIRYTLKKKEVKGLFKCPECKNNLDEQMFCVKCCSKWAKLEPEQETIEEAEIEWSDIEDITDLPIDDQATYYDAGGISTMDVIKAKLTEDQFKGFLLGNVIKYSCRLNYKDNSKRDAEKVANYSKILSEL